MVEKRVKFSSMSSRRFGPSTDIVALHGVEYTRMLQTWDSVQYGSGGCIASDSLPQPPREGLTASYSAVNFIIRNANFPVR